MAAYYTCIPGFRFRMSAETLTILSKAFISFVFLTRTRQDVGRDSSVGIATGYGLDGPCIESRWRRDFPHLSRLALGPTQPPI